MRYIFKASTVAAAVLGMAVGAQAQFSQVTSSGALGANDFIDWGQFGNAISNVGSSANGLTNGGIAFTVTSEDEFGNLDGGQMTRVDEGNGWTGQFQPGDKLLYHVNSFINSSNTITSGLHIHFNVAVAGVGVQAQSNTYGAFTSYGGYWTGNTFVGLSQNSGISSGNHGGAAYTGGMDTVADIQDFYVVASMDDNVTDNLGFAVGKVDVLTAPVPEPASLAVLGLGLVAVIRRRRACRLTIDD